MRLTQAIYTQKSGWADVPHPGDWDSPNTLIIAFCSPIFFDHPTIIRDLKTRFPLATLIGCSTSGEIQGTQLSDASIVVSFNQFETQAPYLLQTATRQLTKDPLVTKYYLATHTGVDA